MIAVTVLSGVVYGHHMYVAGIAPMLGLGFEILTLFPAYFDSPLRASLVGKAIGDVPGPWKAVVDHTPLSPNATITGGSFKLLNTTTWQQIVGAFAGGTISPAVALRVSTTSRVPVAVLTPSVTFTCTYPAAGTSKSMTLVAPPTLN